ncbi:MAG TPA: hypothetical protein VM680_10865 [Verrucomicrobiae bacterium]|nr:hypothetical protein [Verrucomicrobiae bacterium]
MGAVCVDAQNLNFEGAVAVGSVNTAKVTEASGIAVSSRNAGVFWTHNDGSKDHVYAFAMNGSLLADLDFSKNPDDIEDIAVGPGPDASAQYLYIGDIGSNTADREIVHLYRMVEPAVDLNWASNPVSRTIDSGVENFQLRYPSGKYDAEAVLVDPLERALYIITKEETEAHVFRIFINQLADGETRDLELVRVIAFGKVNGGSISADGTLIALRREDFAAAWVRSPGESVGTALGRAGTPIPVVGPPTEANGEGISFLPDNSGYVTIGEGESSPIYLFRRATAVSCTDAPRFSGPPLVSGDVLQLNVTGCAEATVVVERSATLDSWQEVGTVTLQGGTGTYSESAPQTQMFYRLRQ